MQGQQLKPADFVGLSGDHAIPGEHLLRMFGFDLDVCVVMVTEDGMLTVTQEGKNIPAAFHIAPKFWCRTDELEQAVT